MTTRYSSAPAVILSGNIVEPRGTSLNEAALALTRSLGRRGVPVVRFHPDRSLADLRSRYCVHQPCPNLYDDPDGLVRALVSFAKRHYDRPVLFPASDAASQFIADHERCLHTYFRLTSPSASCVGQIQDKRRLIETARRAGIGVPETHFPTCLDEVCDIAAEMAYPIVVKPLRSTDWKTARARSVLGPVKALRARNRQELTAIATKALAVSKPFMVQEVVSGPEESLLTFIGYVGRDRRARAGCVRKKLRQWPPGFGYCTLTETIDAPEIATLSLALLETFDYRGIGAVEFKRDPVSGIPKLVEINARAVRTTALAAAAGVDVPWIAYQDAIGQAPSGPLLRYAQGVRWVHLCHELKAAGALVARGEFSFWRWLRGFRGKRLVAAEFSWDDPRPALLYWSSRNVVRGFRASTEAAALQPEGVS